MNVEKQIVINRPVQEVWKVLAEDFDQAYRWMRQVRHSYRKEEGDRVATAPMVGRTCELSDTPDGLRAEEFITHYDPVNYGLGIAVEIENASAAMPIKRNDVMVKLRPVDDNVTEVLWTATPDLKLHGKVLSPLVKAGLGQAFGGILKDLKQYVEGNAPQPVEA